MGFFSTWRIMGMLNRGCIVMTIVKDLANWSPCLRSGNLREINGGVKCGCFREGVEGTENKWNKLQTFCLNCLSKKSF